MAGNFVHIELSMHSNYPTYSWQQARTEIEFIHQCRDSTAIPAEVTGGFRTRAQSLRSYMERYDPSRAVILAEKQDKNGRQCVQIWPSYDAQFLNDL